MKIVRLEEIVDILDNLRIPINSAERANRIGSVPYYGATGQVGMIDKAIFNETLILLGEDGVPFFDPTKHKAYEISGPSWVNNHAHVLRAKSELVIQRYLLHFLNSFNYAGYVNGATRLKLTQGDMRRIPVPLPSVEEQKDIVKKLDSAFTEINFLESILKLSDDKASQLLQSILNDMFADPKVFVKSKPASTRDISSGKKVLLVDVCKLVGGGTPSKARQDYYLGDIPWATVRDLHSRWLEITEHSISSRAVQESSTNVIPTGNVVLASRVGLGKVVQLKQDTAINQDLRALIPRNQTELDSTYLYYWTVSITPKIIAAGKGATVQGVTLPFLENLEIPLPSRDRQKEIVEKLDIAFLNIERMRNQIAVKKDFASMLRLSLLSDAFSSFNEMASV